MATIPQQLGFDEEETKVFNELIGRQIRAFNALPDNNSKIMFIRGMVEERRTWREKS
ncbi:2267_t:CDS:1, partial [Funneliformis caledonium]